MIYADNAATTELDEDAFEVMKYFLLENFSNASQPYLYASHSKKAISDARKTIAKCIGADPDEIYFTSSGTESDNWAIKMVGGDVITSVIEHHAVLNSCNAIKQAGRIVRYLPVTRTGEVDPDYLDKFLTNNIKLVSIMYANNEIGSIQPINLLAEVAHKHNCIFHTDAVQAVGHVDIDVHDLGVDMLSASAHKFNGPKGIGFLYIKKGLNIHPYMDGGSQEKGLRAGTENVASIVAMSIALENNCRDIKVNRKHIVDLETLLIKQLNNAGIKYIRNGSENRIPGNVNLSFYNIEGEMILHRMDLQGICISTGSACDSKNTKISHVIKAIGVPKEYAEGTIRISLGKKNTQEEVVTIANTLINIFK